MEHATNESEAKLQRDSVLLNPELRSWWVLKVLKRFEDVLLRWDVSPNSITMFGLLVSVVCGVLYATNHVLLAGWCVLLTGSIDILDGRIARATNQVTKRGGFLDSSIDRYQDFLLFSGLAFLYRDHWLFLVILAGLGGTMITPYIRARGESLGIDLKDVGSMQRPERIFLLGVGSVLSSVLQISLMPFYGMGVTPPQHLLMAILIVMAISTNWTALRRLLFTLKALEEGNES